MSTLVGTPPTPFSGFLLEENVCIECHFARLDALACLLIVLSVAVLGLLLTHVVFKVRLSPPVNRLKTYSNLRRWVGVDEQQKAGCLYLLLGDCIVDCQATALSFGSIWLILVTQALWWPRPFYCLCGEWGGPTDQKELARLSAGLMDVARFHTLLGGINFYWWGLEFSFGVLSSSGLAQWSWVKSLCHWGSMDLVLLVAAPRRWFFWLN